MTIAAGNWGGLDSVAGESQSLLDQINLMCYDMGWQGRLFLYNSALAQASTAPCGCDGGQALTAAGVPAAKIGIGIPFTEGDGRESLQRWFVGISHQCGQVPRAGDRGARCSGNTASTIACISQTI